MKQTQDGKVPELYVVCPCCGSDELWHQEWMYTRQTLESFHPPQTVSVQSGGWPFDVEWGDNFENVYECTMEYTDGLEGKDPLPFWCRSCFADLGADELVLTDPANDYRLWEVPDDD